MRLRGLVYAAAVILLILLVWRISDQHSHIHERARDIQHIFSVHEISWVPTTTPAASPKCKLSKVCPIDHFAFQITSGAADVVGPKICFEGKIVMSGVINNVGHGLNIVVVNGENGTVEKCAYLNMIIGKPEDILAYLKDIKPGMIVLAASFHDVAKMLTDEMREIFDALGSTMIKSIKHRDSWVFAGGAGTNEKSPFEKVAVSDPKSNIYEGWPDVAKIGGCFPRKI
ncbi:protein FAM3C-like [Osmerus mordax]|uniref:protein FAM3C-like n=1 Tax=Osmerus mordax TaxID=8014 RepID=UPI003510CEB8